MRQGNLKYRLFPGIGCKNQGSGFRLEKRLRDAIAEWLRSGFLKGPHFRGRIEVRKRPVLFRFGIKNTFEKKRTCWNGSTDQSFHQST